VRDTVELRGFMQLESLFRKRGWLNPHPFKLDRRVTGLELLVLLNVLPEEVEVIFVNRTAFPLHLAIVQPGDRVALVPPGMPGPYRLLLGFKNS
jgi:hypothetical protein